MSKLNNSNVLLSISVFLFLLSLAISLLTQPDKVTSDTNASSIAQADNFIVDEHTVFPIKTLEVSDWNPPSAQDESEKWIYDIFTPPRIYINPVTNEFEPTAYQFETDYEFPDVKVVGVERAEFRFQLNGYIETSSGQTDNFILLIHDNLNGETHRTRLSDQGTFEGWELLNFRVVRQLNESGAITRTGVLEIRNSINSDSKHLTTARPALDNEHFLTLNWEGKLIRISQKRPFYANEGFSLIWESANDPSAPIYVLITNDSNGDQTSISN